MKRMYTNPKVTVYWDLCDSLHTHGSFFWRFQPDPESTDRIILHRRQELSGGESSLHSDMESHSLETARAIWADLLNMGYTPRRKPEYYE